MLIVYFGIVLFCIGLILLIKCKDVTFSGISLLLAFSFICGLAATRAISEYTANNTNMCVSTSQDSYSIIEIDGYSIFENEDGNYEVYCKDDNYLRIECVKDATWFVQSANATNVVTVYHHDYKSPVLRHLLFNMFDDSYIICCDFNIVKPYVRVPR